MLNYWVSGGAAGGQVPCRHAKFPECPPRKKISGAQLRSMQSADPAEVNLVIVTYGSHPWTAADPIDNFYSIVDTVTSA